MDADNNETNKAETPLLKGIKKIVTVPKITPMTRKDSEARKLAYVEFAGTVSVSYQQTFLLYKRKLKNL